MIAQRKIPTPPGAQIHISPTFTPPPLDGSLSIPEQYDWHLKKSPNHPLFIYARPDGALRTILWAEAVKAVYTGARMIRKIMGWKAGLGRPPVIAILASSDTLTYFTMFISILRAGYVAFPISPRNSPAAVAHLLGKINVAHAFVGPDLVTTKLGEEALKILTAQDPNTCKPSFSTMPMFEHLFLDSEAGPDADDIPYERRGQDEIMVYMHSSGSTTFPKAIAWSSYRFCQLALCPYFEGRNLTGVIWSCHATPMYHGMGGMQLCWTASTGTIVSAFEPKFPAVIPTPKNLFDAAVACNSDIIICVPAIIEAWSRQPDCVKWLATRSALLFGGSPLNKTVGDYLATNGVSLCSLYGFTEGGILSPIIPDKDKFDWEYFRFAENVTAEMIPQGDGTHEFVMVGNRFLDPSAINTDVNGVPAYASSDLFTPHPTKHGYWRVHGRIDDQIMHSTGEKTNPVPLESILSQDVHVLSSIMFGRGQFQAGIIIDPKPEFKFDAKNEVKLAEFRNMIWPTVQQMNKFAPQHSRIFKEMILVAKPSKPFQYTAKNTPRRHAIIAAYDAEIQSAYNAFSDSTQSAISPPKQWDFLSTLDFVRSVVGKVLPQNIGDKADIFQHGCDSLQATWIRNTIIRALRDSAELETRHLVDNFVYDHPTILALASFIKGLATGEVEAMGKNHSHVTAMRAMADKYAQFRVSSNDRPSGAHDQAGDIVIVTGTTGALGAYLLAELIHNQDVSLVYALNRAGDLTLKERQRKSLFERGLDPDVIMKSKKLVLLEANLSIPQFGIEENIYEQMRSSVTHIVHNAWRVDFNLSLASFEANVKGLHNLINFTLGSLRPSPPTLIFTSTIGIFQNIETLDASSLPESVVTSEVAVATGYTESKWVSEEILVKASKSTGLNSIIVRVGQLSGGLNGYWNTAEWLPSLVQSGTLFGCIPTDDRPVDWIPLHIAAKALLDFRTCGSSGSSTILHLINPKPALWSSLAETIAAELSIQLVPYEEWLSRLERTGVSENNDEYNDVEAMRATPALRLLPFFRVVSNKAAKSRNALGSPRLSADTAIRLSSTLKMPSEAIQLGEKDAKLWLQYWKNVGFCKI